LGNAADKIPSSKADVSLLQTDEKVLAIVLPGLQEQLLVDPTHKTVDTDFKFMKDTDKYEPLDPAH